MADYIKHFIWSYQGLYRSHLENTTRTILESLKPGLNANVFLVGIGIKPQVNSQPACVEPENNHWAQSSEFYTVLNDSDEYRNAYPESKLRQSNPTAQYYQTEKLFHRSLRDAVLKKLENIRNRPKGIKIFVSDAALRDNFLVFTVITVNSKVLNTVPFIEDNLIRLTEFREWEISRSIVEATIEQISKRANEVIIRRDAGAGLEFLGSKDQILRQAGFEFFCGLINRVDRDSLMIGAAPDLFDNVSRVAVAPYERAEPRGKLLFSGKKSELGTKLMSLSNPLSMRMIKAIRKMLEMAQDEIYLRCNCESAFSLVHWQPRQSNTPPSEMVLRIEGRGKWTVSLGSQDLMTMNDGYPEIPRPVVDQRKLAENLLRLFPLMAKEVAIKYAGIGEKIAASGHGALIVIAENASEEADRLGKEGLCIESTTLTIDLSSIATKIDGAVLCDAHGQCHAIGVILDGKASKSGDPGRGSRFNSALRYLHSNLSPSAAMVVSEDGGLDLLPKLMPVLSRNELLEKIAELEELTHRPSSPVNRKAEVDLMTWLETHEFYLDQNTCDNANKLIAVCNERSYQESQIRVGQKTLRPNEKFDPQRDLVD